MSNELVDFDDCTDDYTIVNINNSQSNENLINITFDETLFKQDLLNNYDNYDDYDDYDNDNNSQTNEENLSMLEKAKQLLSKLKKENSELVNK